MEVVDGIRVILLAVETETDADKAVGEESLAIVVSEGRKNKPSAPLQP